MLLTSTIAKNRAPERRRLVKSSVPLWKHAQCNGVAPCSGARLISALAAISFWMMCDRFLLAARHSGVPATGWRALTSAPICRRRSPTSSKPVATAMCSAERPLSSLRSMSAPVCNRWRTRGVRPSCIERMSSSFFDDCCKTLSRCFCDIV
jgi:hypothetical protein